MKKKRKLEHDTLMAEIQQKQLSTDKLSVFKSSSTLGKKKTKKDIVKQAFYKEKLGLTLDEKEKETLHIAVEKETPETEQPQSESSDEDVPEQPVPEPATTAMEVEPLSEEESDAPPVPTYVEEVKEILESAPAGLDLRLNDDSLEDMRRIREDLATSIPEELKKRAYFVNVQRSAAIEEQRSKLPVCGMEQEIMEAINYHDVVIVCGETGSGKTTQVRLR